MKKDGYILAILGVGCQVVVSRSLTGTFEKHRSLLRKVDNL